MIDLVQAWLDGRFSEVRDGLRTPEREIMSDQYDNSNQLALWNPRNEERRKGYYTGGGPKSDFGGDQIRSAALIVADNTTSPNAPFAELWWRTDKATYCTGIFNNDGKLGGKVDGWWVNIYKNEGKGPPLRVKFKAMEPAHATASLSEIGDLPDDLPL